MKKVGQFFFTFLPLLLTIGIQFLIAFFAMGISWLIEQIWYTSTQTADIYCILDDLSYFWTSNRFNTYVMVCYAVINIAVFGLWYYIKYDGCYLPKPRAVFHPLSILGILFLVPGMQYLSTYIVSFTASLFPHWLEVYEEMLETAGLDDRITVGMFLYSVLLGPIAEELIFRGVTMRQAKKCFPFWAANLMQAVLFGIFHMNMIQGIYAFCLGLILGYICEKSGSIYNSILLHMLFNFWGTVISQFLTIGDSLFAFLFWFLFAITMTTVGLVVFTVGTKKCSAIQLIKTDPPAPERTETNASAFQESNP